MPADGDLMRRRGIYTGLAPTCVWNAWRLKPGVEMPGPSPKRGKTAAQSRLEAQEKARKAVQLRTLRYSYDQIAREVGYASKGAAHTAVKNALAAIPREAAIELRDLELNTLDIAQRAMSRQISRGHLGSIDRMIRIMDHRAKLLGLYEPMPDTGIDEIKTVLAAWLGKIKDEDDPDDLPVPDAEEPA